MKKVLVMVIFILLIGFTGCSGNSDNNLKVISDSMSPEIKMGDTIVYEKIAFDSLEIGDIIVYKSLMDNNGMFISRIIDINKDEKGKYLILKGDANLIANIDPVYEEDYVGKVTKIN